MLQNNFLDWNKQIIKNIEALYLPFCSQYNLTTFAYIRFYQNGIIHFCNNYKWLEYYIDQGLQFDTNRYVEEAKQIKDNFCAIPRVTPSKSKKPKIITVLNYFNIYHGISIYKKTKNVIEVFNFATNKNNEKIWIFYLNELDLLKEFIIYFRSKLHSMIDLKNIEQTLLLPAQFDFYSALNENVFRSRYFDESFIKKGVIINGIKLSFMEIQCLSLIAHGMSYELTASFLKISRRTVEAHVDKLKRKTGKMSKVRLSEFYWGSELSGLFTQKIKEVK